MKDGLFGACKECIKARSTEWIRAHPEARAVYEKRRDRAKVLARNRLKNAIRFGLIERGPCDVCGTTEGIEAHHEDYSRPLDVRWLCRKHHGEVHTRNRVGWDDGGDAAVPGV
jgi:hypothetical protein